MAFYKEDYNPKNYMFKGKDVSDIALGGNNNTLTYVRCFDCNIYFLEVNGCRMCPKCFKDIEK